TQVHNVDRLVRVDRPGHDNLRLPAQAVAQLRQRRAREPQVVVEDFAVVVQVGQREVALEGPIGKGGTYQVVANGGENIAVADERPRGIRPRGIRDREGRPGIRRDGRRFRDQPLVRFRRTHLVEGYYVGGHGEQDKESP